MQQRVLHSTSDKRQKPAGCDKGQGALGVQSLGVSIPALYERGPMVEESGDLKEDCSYIQDLLFIRVETPAKAQFS